MEVIKKSTNKNTKSIEGKTTRQIWLIYCNKIEITTLKLYSKPEFTINWEKYNNTSRNKYNLTTKLVARSFTLNISILCDCSTQIIVLEKTPIYLHCVSWAKEKSHFLFSPQCHTKHYSFSFSRLQICVSLFSLSESLSLFMKPTRISFI